MGNDELAVVEIWGCGDAVSVDGRLRFRLPDAMVDQLRNAFARNREATNLPPDAVNRLPFYFAPGTGGRIFLYPAPNIEFATQRFERPPAGIDPDVLRKARDYFYGLLRFVEADRQNRLQIPDALRKHAGMDDGVDRVVLTCRGRWFTIARLDAEQEQFAGRKASFDECSEDVLDPVDSGDLAQPPRLAGDESM